MMLQPSVLAVTCTARGAVEEFISREMLGVSFYHVRKRLTAYIMFS